MREILFRGKRANNGTWLLGDCRHWRPDRIGIHDYDLHHTIEIIAETLGQYTGLTDKNGKKIFEGDICKIRDLIYKVDFKHSCWWFTILSNKVYCCPAFSSHCGELCEVIGNIHDNPELLEVQHE